MKQFLLPLALLLFFAVESKAQLAAHAGNDTAVCPNAPVQLGGNPTATGGTPPYTYQWSMHGNNNIGTQPNMTYAWAASTTYFLRVTDSLGAMAYDTLELTVLPFPQVTNWGVSDTIACAGQPVTFFANVTGGAPPYTYVWFFGDGTIPSNVQNPVHTYGPQGNYTAGLQVTGTNGCNSSNQLTIVPVSIFQVIATVIPTNASCSGANNGSLQAVSTGGTPPYFYNWSNGATTQTQNNLSAGTYTLTVSDASQCTATVAATVFEPTPIVAVTSATNESSLGACNGSVVLTVTGGAPPYTYLWNPNVTSQNIFTACSGAYTVTIMDMNLCTATATAFVATDSACNNSTLAAYITSQDLTCTHSVDTMTLHAVGGVPPYSYLWNNGVSGATYINSVAGIYVGWVTDSVGCTRTVFDTITSTGIVVSLAYSIPTTCNGNPVGAAKINVTGGTPPYTFAWSNGATADSIAGVVSGTYIVTVSDAASCLAVFSVFVNQNSTNWSYYVYVNATSSNCTNNGTATVFVQGGTPPFTYLWSNADTTAAITGLAPGISYTVTVTGADGCVRTGSAYIYTNCYNVIRGQIFRDVNNNCTLDSGETGLAYQNVIADGINDYYGSTNAQGMFTIYTTGGSYTVRPYISGGPCLTACTGGNASQTVSFAGLGDTASNVNFYLVPAAKNLLTSYGGAAFRPGFTQTVYVYYKNTGTAPENATLTFTYDADLNYISASNSGVHNAGNRTVTWSLTNITPSLPNSSNYLNYFTVTVQTPVGTPVGTAITNQAYITVLPGECDTVNNRYTVTNLVTNSMDPNEKEVSPKGDVYENDSVLTYTIHFQNTGNDTAWFIVLKDTLSLHLEPASVENIAASHPVTDFTISERGILTWLFNPIFLVDSATNEPASKGFVTFKIKKKTGLPLNTEIKNNASIYFDYNEPIMTNTVSSKLTEPNAIHNVTNDADIYVVAAPNPFTQQTQITVEGVTGAFNFELFDVSGKLLQKKNAVNDSRFILNRDGMSAGIYFYSITTNTKQKLFGRLVIE